MNRSRKAPFNSRALLILNLSLLLFSNGNIASTASEESSNELIIYAACNVEKYSNGSAFERNVNALFNILTRNAVLTGFNASTYGRGSSQVFGRLQCRGDLSPRECRACSLNALNSIRRDCPNAVGARVQLEDCFLRFENYHFISKLDTNLWYRLVNANDVAGPKFRIAVRSLMVDLSARTTSSNYKFTLGSTTVNVSSRNSSTIYGMEMCWRDMSTQDCAACLSRGLENMFSCCPQRAGVQVFIGSCTLRYEIYAFAKYS
jgi:hypothetical protein